MTITETILGFSCCYEIKNIKGKSIYIFDNHEMALPIWGIHSVKNICSYKLYTFDTHCDTHTPFVRHQIQNGDPVSKNYLQKPYIHKLFTNIKFQRNNFSFDDVYYIALKHLNNDEQIKAAYDWKYISEYNIISSESQYITFQAQDRADKYNCNYYHKNNWYENIVFPNNSDSILLDFDLDFFTSIKDFDTLKCTPMSILINKCDAITIAKEPSYFEKCKQDKKNSDYSYQVALTHLLSIIDNSL